MPRIKPTIVRIRFLLQPVIIALAASGMAPAGTVNVDINRSNTPNFSGAGVAPGTGTVWNSFVAPTAATHTQNNLSDSIGAATAASVTITRTNGQSIKTWDDAAASKGKPNPADLMRDYLYQGPYTVALSNLVPGTYTLYVFAHGNNTGQNSTITLGAANGGASATTIDTGDYRDILQPSAAGNTYLALSGTVGAAGTFTFTTSNNLNGFQIYQHPADSNLPDGFGSAATGGAGGPVYTVNNSAQLLARATSVETCTINISGTIDVTGGTGGGGKSVRLLSNKTIQGLDANSTLIGNLDLGGGGVNNIIIRNLNITHPGTTIDPLTGKYSDGGDGITVWAATNVFISHCTFLDCADGSCDITRGSDAITVSWCKFHYTNSLTHQFPMILGNTNESDYHVTLHHNWFAEGCDQRMPSGSYSRAHIYNNYFSCAGNSYCTNVRTGGEFLVENNYYQQVNHPCYKEQGGKIFESGNIFAGCTGHPPGYDLTAGAVTGNDTVFTPNYAYVPAPAADVPSLVMAGAGNIAAPPAPASITFSNLLQTYDNSPKTASVTTTPPGLAVVVTYDGSATPPTNAGSYIVAASIDNPNFTGNTTGTLVIAKAAASITLANLQQIEDGLPKAVTVGTNPAGLAVQVTYNGLTVVPTAPGTYAVEAAVTESNHAGSAVETLIIEAANTWAVWRLAHFSQEEIDAGVADPNANPDGDALPNLGEYALGTDPKTAGNPIVTSQDASGFSVTFTRPAGLPGVNYAAESSDDLDSWSPALLEVITPGTTETVRVLDPLTQGDPGRRFIRLLFSTP